MLTDELDPSLVHLEIDIYWAVTGGIQSGDGAADPEGFTIDVISSAPRMCCSTTSRIDMLPTATWPISAPG